MQRLLLLLCVLLTSSGMMAQTMRVTGKVTDAASGAPVEGATITVKGKNRSVAASAEGVFQLSGAKSDVLVISASGY